MLLRLGNMRLLIWMGVTFVWFLIVFWLIFNLQEWLYGVLPFLIDPNAASIMLVLLWVLITAAGSLLTLWLLWRSLPRQGEPDILQTLAGKEPKTPESKLQPDLKAQYREEAMRLLDEPEAPEPPSKP